MYKSSVSTGFGKQFMQILKNFPPFYGTRRFITIFVRALH
jgi:hypothetical protein